MRRFNDIVQACASGRSVLVLLVITVVSFYIMAAVITPAFQQETGGLRPLDLNFGVDAEKVYADLPAYTERAKRLYVGFAIADYVYPAAAAAFFALFWAWMIRRAPHARYERFVAAGLLAFPFLFALIDWLENIGFLFVVFQYPAEYPLVADTAGLLKKTKPFVELLILIVTLIIGVTTIRLSRRRRRAE